MCECDDCGCYCCEKFSCCYCYCCSCSRKCCGCAFCTTCSLCAGIFGLYFLIGLIVILSSKDNNNSSEKRLESEICDSTDESDICNSIEFKPQYIECNSNNVLYIDLSLPKNNDINFHAYRINLYKYFDIEDVYNKNPFLLSYLEGYVFASNDLTVPFSVQSGEYSLEFKDNLCEEVFYENIYVPPYQSSCENEDQIVEQEIEISIDSVIPEFVIIMDVSQSMSDVINNYIRTIIPGVLSNLNYENHLKLHLVPINAFF